MKVFQPGFLDLSPVDIRPYCGASLGILAGLQAFLASTHRMAVVSCLASVTDKTASDVAQGSLKDRTAGLGPCLAVLPGLWYRVSDIGLHVMTRCWLDCRLDY